MIYFFAEVCNVEYIDAQYTICLFIFQKCELLQVVISKDLESNIVVHETLINKEKI